MKYQKALLLITCVSTMLFTSCNTYYFENPQPVDGEDLYEIPKEFQGVWVDGTDTISIGSKLIEVYTYSDFKVAKSYFDTTSLIKKIGKSAYLISDDKKDVSKGFSYKQDGDSILISKPEAMQFFINQQNFLRRVGDIYVLNRQAENQWWEIFTFAKKENGDLEIRSLSKDELYKLKGLEVIHKTDNDFYLSAKWTEKDMNKLIKKGAFHEEVLILETSQMQPR